MYTDSSMMKRKLGRRLPSHLSRSTISGCLALRDYSFLTVSLYGKISSSKHLLCFPEIISDQWASRSLLQN